MRDRETIEKEMFTAREDLEENLADLRHAVREKVDVKARARKALQSGKQQARDMVRGAIDTTRERPLLVGLIAGAVVLATVAAILIQRRRNRTWWERLWA